MTVKYETKREISAWDKLSKGIKLSPAKKEREPKAPVEPKEPEEAAKEGE